MSPHPPTLPESVSARALRRGDGAAFDLLYAELAPRVLGYLLRLTDNRADAEDLLQETFLAAYDARSKYAGRSQPLAWLLGIARRRWRDGLRRRHPYQSYETLTDEPASDLPAPVNFTDAVDAQDAASVLLAHLPLSDREIIVLSVVQGLSYREIAAIIEKPVGTVKWRAAESLRRLRELSLVEPEEISNAHETLQSPARPDAALADRQPARPARAPAPQADCP